MRVPFDRASVSPSWKTVVPDGPPLGRDLVDRIGNVAGEVLMPLLYTVAGSVISPGVVLHLKAWRVLIVMVVVAWLSKLLATMGPAMYCGFSLRKAFLLGLIMNFQGVLDLITYMNFKNGTLLEEESYTLLVFAIVFITSVATPLVKRLYNPLGHDELVGRRGIQHLRPNAELRVLACLLNEDHIPSTLGLFEASCPAQETPMCVYVLHLVELTGRASSTVIAHRNKKGFINPSKMDRLHNAFINYEQEKKGIVAVQPFTAIAPLKAMHQDICSLAADKSVAIIILPLPRSDATGGFRDQDHAFRSNIPHILSKAPCSVGLLVHMGLTVTAVSTPPNSRHHVGLLFWGGPDDREALSYAARMVRNEGVTLNVTRFLPWRSAASTEREAQMDGDLIEDFRKENSGNLRVLMNEVSVSDMEQTIAAIRNFSHAGYDLVMVGRRLSWNSILNDELEEWSEFPELGVVGDMIASADFESDFFILVVQQRA
ncbi:cation/H(+) antiporter 15-like [Phalaenopsis equestris]|uniref:cation/H(+) antiporter 15-like n=1 Tax=Phalaenopsis equestris TaxID=78828 RepID=UPI0009E22161|nr:cation/H(+) antiporter 15-like [Phalaenopsis equestris]